MGFENFKPNAFEEQNEEEHEESTGEEAGAPGSFEETPIEREENAPIEETPEPEEKTEEQLLEEYWPSPEEPQEEKTGLSWGKAAVAAAALAGTLAAGTEAYAGAPEQFAAEQKNEIIAPHEKETAGEEMESKKNELYNQVLERFRERLQKKDDFSQIKDGYMRRGKEARAARKRAWMQTVIDHPEKVHTTIDAEKRTIFFVGTYTDPDSGVEQPFEQIYQLIKK